MYKSNTLSLFKWNTYDDEERKRDKVESIYFEGKLIERKELCKDLYLLTYQSNYPLPISQDKDNDIDTDIDNEERGKSGEERELVILLHYKVLDNSNSYRLYTPIFINNNLNIFSLLIKKYNKGLFSNHLIQPNNIYQYFHYNNKQNKVLSITTNHITNLINKQTFSFNINNNNNDGKRGNIVFVLKNTSLNIILQLLSNLNFINILSYYNIYLLYISNNYSYLNSLYSQLSIAIENLKRECKNKEQIELVKNLNIIKLKYKNKKQITTKITALLQNKEIDKYNTAIILSADNKLLSYICDNNTEDGQYFDVQQLGQQSVFTKLGYEDNQVFRM